VQHRRERKRAVDFEGQIVAEKLETERLHVMCKARLDDLGRINALFLGNA